MKVLVLNSGSSSLKFQLIDMTDENMLCKGTIERIGEEIDTEEENISYTVADNKIKFNREVKDHAAAINTVMWLLVESEGAVIKSFAEVDAIGHRVVQGGDKYTKSVLIDDKVVADLESLIPLAPLHNPANIEGYKACREIIGPDVPQVAVFDTAFHSTMPQKAYMYAVPYEYYEKYSVRKYGFHGTSHKYISQRCAEYMHEDITKLKLITCHIGNGASITAVKNGKCVDTSMGFTPLDGFMMGTRSGGVDPSVVTYIEQKLNMSPEEMDEILNKESGVKAISGISSDDRDISKAQKEGDERATLAHEMQAYQIAKYIGSYAAAMNGVDAIVFTGGIGENGFWLRSKVCSYLGYLGVKIDEKLNENTVGGAEAELTSSNDKVRVFVLSTNEEVMIARDTKEIVEKL